MTWDRRGGHATSPNGDRLTWSLAEGTRGARWRETTSRDEALVRSILLEVTPAAAVARLEISTVDGLLTLHPERDSSAIHGNVVTPHGVRHLAFDWSPSHELVVIASPTTDAVVVRRRATTVLVGGRVEVDVLAIDDALQPRSERWAIERESVDRWLFRPLAEGNDAWTIHVAPDGRPILEAEETWALEA